MLGGSRSVWAIDVGQTSLKAAKLRKVGKRLQIQALDLVELPRQEAQRGPERQAQIQSALQAFRSRNDLKDSRLLFSVPSSSSYVRFVNLPPVAKKDIPKVVRYEARQQIPYPLEEIIWDYSQVSAPKAPGEEIRIGLYAVRREVVDQLLGELGDRKLSVDLVQMSSLALYSFCKHEGLIKETGIVLGVGASYTDIIIVDQETMMVRSLPLAGDDLTRALAERFKVTFPEAENLKRRVARVPAEQAKTILAAMLPVMRNLASEIQRTLGYYRAQVRNIKFDQIVALGSAFKLPGLRQYLERELTMPVITVRELSGITVGEGVNRSMIDSSLGQFAVALGLGTQALATPESRVNFVPASIRREQFIKAKQPFAVAAVGAMMVIVLTIWGLSGVQARRLAPGVKAAEEILTRLNDYKKSIEEAGQVEEVRKKLEAVRAFGGRVERAAWLEMWSRLGELPPEVAVRSIDTASETVGKVRAFLENSPNVEVRNASAPLFASENAAVTVITAEIELQLGGDLDRSNAVKFLDSQVLGKLQNYFVFAGLHVEGAPVDRGNVLDFELRWLIIP